MFHPQRYNLPDLQGSPFIDPEEIRSILRSARGPAPERVKEVIEKSLSPKRLSLHDTAVLLNAGREDRSMVFEAAELLKKKVYGDRIVIFAPLYIGSKCVNDCSYCGFRTSNRDTVRRTLDRPEVAREVASLSATGQKRLILVFGEHPDYDARFIAQNVEEVYRTQKESDRINRVNINAAPLSVEGFKTVRRAGIGTYQIFQETYDPEIYARVHGRGPKSDYLNRLTAMDRAMQAGIDDVGLGVLLGLGDWRFEAMALVRHTNHLEACFGVGPHTISFPRIQRATNLDRALIGNVPDSEFKYLIAVFRLAVPYAGLILTAREPAILRDELIRYGVSQIDAGTRLEIGGYSDGRPGQELRREQFELSDTRSLEDTLAQLVEAGNIPSFCTACYRRGRTGEHFMQFATSGHIKELCSPNALLSFAEYLEDYAGGPLYDGGWKLIGEKLGDLEDNIRNKVAGRLEAVRKGSRDEYL